MNLVLGAIYGYDWDKIEHFVVSLRKHYDGKVAFIIDQQVEDNTKLKNQLAYFNIDTYLYNVKLNSNHEIQNNRFELYSNIIEKYTEVDKVFITDVRDVLFQSDPFRYVMTTDLEFYAEPALFKECKCNSWWIQTMCGEQVFQEMANEYIICCGTIMGTREGLLGYLQVFREEFERMKAAGRVFIGGEDTVTHNRLIYTNRIPYSVKIVHNGDGAVSTMDHQKTFTFDSEGRYINNDGTPTPIIHQWDRVKPFIDKFNKIALE